MLTELLGHILVGVVRVVDTVLGVFTGLSSLERKMREGSLVGESPQEAESRRWWQRVGDVWFLVGLVLLCIAALLGVAVDLWR